MSHGGDRAADDIMLPVADFPERSVDPPAPAPFVSPAGAGPFFKSWPARPVPCAYASKGTRQTPRSRQISTARSKLR
jgi:hypothetical protein